MKTFNQSLSKSFLLLFFLFNKLLLIVYSEETKQTTNDFEIQEEKGGAFNENEVPKNQGNIGPGTIRLEESPKTQIEWLHISSDFFISQTLQPEELKDKIRNSFEVKPEKTNHINIPEELKKNPRKIDVHRLQEYFKTSSLVDVHLIEAVHLDVGKKIDKVEFLHKLNDFFNDYYRPNKLLFLSGMCSEGYKFIYYNSVNNQIIKIDYDDIIDIWKNRRKTDKHTELLIIIDCIYGSKWVERCNLNHDYKDLSMQSATTGTEEATDIEGFGSLFVNNFIHAQKAWNYTMITELLKPFEQVEKELKENPIISNPYQEKQEEEEQRPPSPDLIKLEDSRFIHLYQQTPSSCGQFFRVAEHFKLNSMFNSWDEIVKNDVYYKEKNYTDINSIYKGEYKDGKPNGRGAIYYMNIKEKYLGDFVFGEKQGRGIYYYNDTNVFEGSWRKDSRIKGVLFGGEGDWYTGDFKSEAFHGKGKFFNREKGTLYEGDFRQGMQSGYGITTFPHGGQYRGIHHNNEFNGKGEFYFNQTLVSVSEYKNGERHGFGWFLLREGHNYTGNWENGIAKGQGKMLYKSGDTYEGTFNKGKPNGEGVFTYLNGNKYEGEMFDGKRHGKGKLFVYNGDQYEGDFKDDEITGQGVLYYEKGIYKGDFVKGKFHGKGMLLLRSGGRFEGDFRDGKVWRHEDDL